MSEDLVPVRVASPGLDAKVVICIQYINFLAKRTKHITLLFKYCSKYRIKCDKEVIFITSHAFRVDMFIIQFGGRISIQGFIREQV